MPEVDVVDDTWIGVRPAVLARVVADPANWRAWWPELTLAVQERRGPKGVRWRVPSGRGGTITGSMEIWLEPADDGTLVHFFARFDGVHRPLRPKEGQRLQHEYRVRMKRALFAVTDQVDPGRLGRVAGPPAAIP